MLSHGSGSGSFDDFARRADPRAQALLRLIRRFALALAPDVVEEVRPHRIVFGKGASLRNFAEAQPRGQHLLLAVRLKGDVPPLQFPVEQVGAGWIRCTLATPEDFEAAAPLVTQAYQRV